MKYLNGDMKVFSGNANPKLGEDICKHLNIPVGKIEVGRFSDNEININIGEMVRGYDIYVVQPTCMPVNDNLMELLIIIDALKRASAGRINAVIPYYGYARQDRKTRGRDPITAKLVANLIEKAGADRVITMDLHAGQIQGYFDIPVDHLLGTIEVVEYFRKIVDDSFCIVSPDLGGVTRARDFAAKLDLPIAIIEKRRPKANVSEVVNLIGDIKGKNCIIVDDIIDTAGTITNAANALVQNGANKVYITASHGILSGEAIKRIEESVVEKCVITDSIPQGENVEKSEKIEVVSVAKYIADAIKRINENQSISALFNR